MPLPKISLPIFELELPSNGQRVQYVPFTVKEEKILLIAQESKDPDQIVTAIKQIVRNCIVNYDIDKLALFDLEYILLMIRAKSVDNVVKFQIEDPDTNEKVDLELNLNEVKIEKDPRHTNKIKLNEEYYLFLKYPSIDNLNSMMSTNDDENRTEKSFDVLLSCIDKLVSENEVYSFSDFTKKEIDEFIESLNSDVTKLIKEFFDTIPKIRHEIEYTNSKGNKKTFVIEGTQTFFI